MRLHRLSEIEQYVLKKGTVSLEELAERFKVSMNTMRRDIDEIASRGLIKKVYGGVTVVLDAAPLSLSDRSAIRAAEKEAIGKQAAELVADGDCIYLDSGTTVERLLPHVAQKSRLTVVTHSLPAMYTAAMYPNIQVVALGGLYNNSSASFTGLSVNAFISEVFVDTTFIAATGVALESGLTNSIFMETEIKKALVKSSKRLVLMADHSKFDHSATFSYASLDELHHVVTDREPPRSYVEFFAQCGCKLHVADKK